MATLSDDDILMLKQHSIVTWKRIYVAVSVALFITFLSTALAGNTPIWGAASGVGVLFSLVAVVYASVGVIMTTYYESRAKHDYTNSMFARANIPWSIFIAKDALK